MHLIPWEILTVKIVIKLQKTPNILLDIQPISDMLKNNYMSGSTIIYFVSIFREHKQKCFELHSWNLTFIFSHPSALMVGEAWIKT